MKEKALSIRLDEDMYTRLKNVAEVEGRTLNAQVKQFLIKGFVRYEKEIGAIEALDSEDDAPDNSTPAINQQEKVG